MSELSIKSIYEILLKNYGPQGWWPLYKQINQFENPNSAYHPGHYNSHLDDFNKFQIITGTILTQNTNWKNVLSALKNLWSANINSFNKILKTETNSLAKYIKPSGVLS